MGDSRENAKRYAAARDRQLVRELGAGYDGSVFATDRMTAIKSFEFTRLFERERDIYLRLFELRLTEVEDCTIPELIDYDDKLLIVEMQIVQPPFVLDFAGAYLDTPPDYPDDVYTEWLIEKEEQ